MPAATLGSAAETAPPPRLSALDLINALAPPLSVAAPVLADCLAFIGGLER